MANDLKNMLVTDIVLNEANPRSITEDKMQLLIQSILVFPKMLSLRPVVADASTHIAYGGNMRTRALLAIKDMPAANFGLPAKADKIPAAYTI